MGMKDERVDLYIQKAEEFAKPILIHLRSLVHQTLPEVQETIKWSFPHFEQKGIICSMAAFKNHCAFGFTKGAMLSDPYGILSKIGETAMGQLGKINSLKDLPENHILTEYILEAALLNIKGIKASLKTNKTDLLIPDYIVSALAENPKAKEVFNKFSYSHKKEYVSWIIEAKTEATREKRISTMLEWLEEGKSKNWKYERK
jgi:uncharacterized protein YdeI (YjbR/CyaY-like superfamily)